jgi:TetR/AcrR family transcriptional regulator, acrAB operon repressor
MVRRTKKEAAATRETLLDAAERVFRAKGVAHTSLAEVAQAAGLTRGAVYWHFRDKADLFQALCDRATLPMESMLAAAGNRRHDDPLATLSALAVGGLTTLARDARAQAVFDVMFNKCEFTAELAAVAERRNSSDCGCLTPIERLLRQAIGAGQMPDDTDVRLAALCMNAFMVGVMHQWVSNPAAFDLERSAPAMVDALIAGLRACPPRRAAPAARRATGRLARAALVR